MGLPPTRTTEVNAPDQELLHAFGNEDVYADKLAGRSELVARLAMGLMGYGIGRSELARQRSHQAEAEAMNEAFEHMQAMQLQQAESGARHTRPRIVIPAPVPGMRRWDGDAVPVGMDEGMVRLASVAYDVGADMAKEAFPSAQPLIEGAKKLFGKIGPAVAQGPKMTGASGVVQAAPKPPPGVGQAASTLSAGAAGGGLLGGLGTKLQNGLQQTGIKSMRGAAMTAGGLALGGLAIKKAVGGVRKGVDVMAQEAGPAQYGAQQHGGSRVPNGINEYGQPDLRTPFM